MVLEVAFLNFNVFFYCVKGLDFIVIVDFGVNRNWRFIRYGECGGGGIRMMFSFLVWVSGCMTVLFI